MPCNISQSTAISFAVSRPYRPPSSLVSGQELTMRRWTLSGCRPDPISFNTCHSGAVLFENGLVMTLASRKAHITHIIVVILRAVRQKKLPIICQFEAPISDRTHSKPEVSSYLYSCLYSKLHPYIRGLLVIYRLQRDESWHSWLTHSRQFSHRVVICQL